jgi:hypothetical protein
MAADRIAEIAALLAEAQEAHHVFETTELHGVFDAAWPRWYAAYAIDHGIGPLLGRAITIEALARFLGDSNVELAQLDPAPGESWAAFTARRLTEELTQQR